MLLQRQRMGTLTNQNDKMHQECSYEDCQPCGKLMCMHRACTDGYIQ